jgi:hypothetical protein
MARIRWIKAHKKRPLLAALPINIGYLKGYVGISS